MMRLACLGDSHLSESKRLDDNCEVHRAFITQALDAGIDVILHAGDLYHAKSSPVERNAAMELVSEMADVAPVLLVRGNHDYPGDLAKFSYLRRVTVHERPGVELGVPGLALISLPWFDKAHLAAQYAADATQQQTTHATIAAAQQMLTTLRAQASEARAAGLVPILVGHVQVAGSETSTGQTLIGQTVELDPGAIHDVGCEYAHLGHIHRYQSWYGGRVAYSGSPQRHDFGEPEAKGWVLVTIGDDGKFQSAEFRELPARRIVLIECDWTKGVMPNVLTGENVRGALVRLRYRIRPEVLAQVDDARLTQRLVDAGAHEVKLEAIVEVQERVRCEQIVTAQTTWDKVLAYLQAKQITLGDEQLERLRSKLGTIESGDAAGREAA